VGFTGPAWPSRLPPLSLPHSVTRANPNTLSSLAILNRRRPRRSIPANSDGLRRRHVGHLLHLVKRFHLTAGIRRLRRRSSPSPPSITQSICPRGSICSGLASLGLLHPFSVPAVVPPPPRRLDGMSATPGVVPRCGAVLGRSAVSTVLLRRRRSPPNGGFAATTVGAPTVSPPWSSS
jgi:hypothetical protein